MAGMNQVVLSLRVSLFVAVCEGEGSLDLVSLMDGVELGETGEGVAVAVPVAVFVRVAVCEGDEVREAVEEGEGSRERDVLRVDVTLFVGVGDTSPTTAKVSAVNAPFEGTTKITSTAPTTEKSAFPSKAEKGQNTGCGTEPAGEIAIE